MPNVANRPETNICVWCGNEFYHEVYEAGAQTGSVGLMCAACQVNHPFVPLLPMRICLLYTHHPSRNKNFVRGIDGTV
ncbi:uncharacterized protein Pyn_11257 [Prunus yedoensis var. nudiflora]|uniref:Uncharacterized protein n=1 Tax=Prunus yedoensis var. nudiflora TaxID=2094558 RepID=A0A314YD11_PRUYE|nr:uncharacterized protein Pyn_11257 [Prunus yedoensis var. nudiflora]